MQAVELTLKPLTGAARFLTCTLSPDAAVQECNMQPILTTNVLLQQLTDSQTAIFVAYKWAFVLKITAHTDTNGAHSFH